MGHTLNTLQPIITNKSRNVLSKFVTLCWATFIAMLSHTWPRGLQVGPTIGIYFLVALETRRLRSRFWLIQFLARAIVLACWKPPFCWVLMWTFLSPKAERRGESYSVAPSFVRTPVPLDQHPTLLTSSSSGYLLMARYSDIITTGVGLRHMNSFVCDSFHSSIFKYWDYFTFLLSVNTRMDTSLGNYTWGIILGNEIEFVKNKWEIIQRFKFTEKGSLSFWNAYIIEFLNTCSLLPAGTKSNNNM